MNIIETESFQPDYRNVLQVLHNERPKRLPLYEHHIDASFIAKALGKTLALQGDNQADLLAYYREVIGFWRDMTYDGFDYEAAICDIFPGHGAILGGRGPIQNRRDFEDYPFDGIDAKHSNED